MAGFESYTDLSRKYGRNSTQRRFAGLYRDEQQQQAVAAEASAKAQSAPFGSLESRDNPMAYGSVFRRENQGIAGAFDAQQASLRREQQDKAQEEQDKNMLREQARRESLQRAKYNGSIW